MLQTFSCNGYNDTELQSQMYSFLTSIGSRSLVDSQYNTKASKLFFSKTNKVDGWRGACCRYLVLYRPTLMINVVLLVHCRYRGRLSRTNMSMSNAVI